MKVWIQKIIGFGLASFFSDFSHEMTVALIPTIVANIAGAAHAPFFLGITVSLTEGFSAFLRLFSGYASDNISHKKPLIAIGYFLSALFSTLTGFARSFASILSYRMLSFAGSGLREPPRDVLIAATIEPAYYGRAFGLKSAMDTLGSLVGPLVGFLCAGYFTVKEIFLLSFIPGILSVFAIIFFTSDIAVPTGKLRMRLTILQEIKNLPKSFILFLMIITVFDLAALNKLLLIARAQQIVTSAHIAQLSVLLYAVFNATRACSEFLIGWLSDYVNRLFLLALLGCSMLTVSAYMLITPHASLIYCACIFMTAGISTAAVTTLKKSCAALMLPEELRGLGFGILQASEGLAALISSALIGSLWTYYSAFVGFTYVIIFSGIATLLLLLFSIFSSDMLKQKSKIKRTY